MSVGGWCRIHKSCNNCSKGMSEFIAKFVTGQDTTKDSCDALWTILEKLDKDHKQKAFKFDGVDGMHTGASTFCAINKPLLCCHRTRSIAMQLQLSVDVWNSGLE